MGRNDNWLIGPPWLAAYYMAHSVQEPHRPQVGIAQLKPELRIATPDKITATLNTTGAGGNGTSSGGGTGSTKPSGDVISAAVSVPAVAALSGLALALLL